MTLTQGEVVVVAVCMALSNDFHMNNILFILQFAHKFYAHALFTSARVCSMHAESAITCGREDEWSKIS